MGSTTWGKSPYQSRFGSKFNSRIISPKQSQIHSPSDSGSSVDEGMIEQQTLKIMDIDHKIWKRKDKSRKIGIEIEDDLKKYKGKVDMIGESKKKAFIRGSGMNR